MTDLNHPCAVCGEIWGTHPAKSHENVCLWIMDAAWCSYDNAEDRYRAGMWTQSQWEAFTVGHVYSMERYPLQDGYFEAFPDVADLFVRLEDHLTAIGLESHDSLLRSRYDRAKAVLA